MEINCIDILDAPEKPREGEIKESPEIGIGSFQDRLAQAIKALEVAPVLAAFATKTVVDETIVKSDPRRERMENLRRLVNKFYRRSETVSPVLRVIC